MGDESNSGSDQDVRVLYREGMPRLAAASEVSEEGLYGSDSVPTEPRLHAVADCSGDWALESPRAEAFDARSAIARICDDLRDFLLAKNDSYGNSAFEPINIFSQLDAKEGILIRIDDKLKRIRNGQGYPGDNDLKDLTGYLILLMVLLEETE